MTETGVAVPWQRRAWFLVFIGLFEFCNAANAQFIPVSGSADYATTGNWTNGIVNGQFTSPITGNLAVTFAADHAQAGSESGLLFSVNGGGNTLTLQSADSTTHLFTLNGDVATGDAGGNTVVIGSSANPLNVDLGGASRTFNISNAADTVTVANTISGVGGTLGINKAGAGTLVLSGANTFSGGVTIPTGKVTAHGPGTLGTGAVTLSGGTLSVGSGSPTTISGFDSNSWTVNGSATILGSGALQLTPIVGGTGSAWYNISRIATGPFTLGFTYTVVGPSGNSANGVDGITVGFQNSAAGLSAIGGGGGLGWSGISPSVALHITIDSPNSPAGPGSGWAMRTNGVTTNFGASTNPVNMGASNNSTQVTLTYDGTNASLHLVQSGIGFDAGPVPIPIGALVGSSAILGFTGATGAVVSQQQITSFS